MQFPRVPNFSELTLSSESHFARMPGLVASVPVFASKIPICVCWCFLVLKARWSLVQSHGLLQFPSLCLWLGGFHLKKTPKISQVLSYHLPKPQNPDPPHLVAARWIPLGHLEAFLMDCLEQKKTIMGALFAAIMGRYGDIGISIVSGLSENDGESIEKLKILC